MSYFAVRDVYCSIGGTKILNGISLEVQPGECVGVIGPNGSGKTTLFNCISGFLPVRSGTISFQDTVINQLEPYQRARLGIGRVFQNPGVFREMTILENMQLAYEGRSVRYDRSESEELLKIAGLHERLGDRTGNLSGGQMRLLEIVRSLALGAELLFFDEPTAGVSPKMRQKVAELMREFQQRKKTLLVIEHDLPFIQSLASRVVVVDAGTIALDGSPATVRNNPRLQEIYFGGQETQSDQ